MPGTTRARRALTLTGIPADEAGHYSHYSLHIALGEDRSMHVTLGRMDPTTHKYEFVRIPDYELGDDDGRRLCSILETVPDQIWLSPEARHW
jgi:hypothetical protein